MQEKRTMAQMLGALRGEWREQFLTHQQLTTQLRAWADAFPDIAHLESIGTSPQGRELWVMTVGRDPERPRPAVWVDGNMHAAELSGTNVALAIIEALLVLHGIEPNGAAVARPMAEAVRDTLVHVMPRMSPDGAEAVLTTGRYVRSVPRDDRPKSSSPRWISEDVDGDGLALVMRVRDPGGEFVEAESFAGLLVPREIGDPGPYYKLYPEGHIEGFDGARVPDPSFLSDNDPDLNRNFPFHWAPDHQQLGAGRYPLSEPESRAVVEFTAARPHLFAWLNLHTFGGVFIRPLGDAPDSKMKPYDLAVYKQLEQWAAELTGYPTVSGYAEFTYEPDTPLHGDLLDYAYRQRGCVAWVCELWDLFEQVGLDKPDRFVERYSRLDRSDLVRLAQWDREHNGGRTIRPWKPFQHPQLGEVEIGGIDPRFGYWNPPVDQLPQLCDAHSALFVRMVAMAPRVQIAEVDIEALADGIHQVSVVVENRGYLPTYVLESAKELSWNAGLVVEAEAVEGQLVDPQANRVDIGHLEGWGRGRHSGFGALYFQRSRGTGHRARARFLVRGARAVRVEVRSPRTGSCSRTVELPRR